MTTVLVFDLTSIQDRVEKSHYPELVGEPLRVNINFFPLEKVTEPIVVGERWSSISVVFFRLLGCEKYSFLKQHNEQTMPEPLEPRPCVCGFYTIYAAFPLFKFRPEESKAVQKVKVILCMNNYMCYFNLFHVNVCFR